MVCPKCGKENHENAKFCGFCGVSLQAASQSEVTAEAIPAVRKKQGKRTALIIIILIIIAAAIGILIWMHGNSNKTDSADGSPVQNGEAESVSDAAAEAGSTPEVTTEPSPELTPELSQPEYSERQFPFNDILLALDEGFQRTGEYVLVAGEDAEQEALYKPGFGRLELFYEKDSDFSDYYGNTIENDRFDTIVFRMGPDTEGPITCTADIQYISDHYSMVFTADPVDESEYTSRYDEILEWINDLLLTLDLTSAEKEAADARTTPAPTPEPSPAQTSVVHIVELHDPEHYSAYPQLWLGADLDAYGYPESAPEQSTDEYIHLMVVDYSEIIAIDLVGMEEMSAEHESEILSRCNDLLGNFFSGEEVASKIKLVNEPEKADVILCITTSYPFAGKYGLTGSVNVYNCHVDVWAWKVGTQTSQTFSYAHDAGSSVSARPGATTVWKTVPDDMDNEVGRTILSWFSNE